MPVVDSAPPSFVAGPSRPEAAFPDTEPAEEVGQRAADERAAEPDPPGPHASSDAPSTAAPGRAARLVGAARRHPIRSGLLIAVAGLLLVASVSYGQKLAEPGNDDLGEKTVEWLRDNHFGGLVNLIERQWYTANAPPEGGDPRAIDGPPPATARPGEAEADHLPPPAPISSPASPTVSGEGQWRPVGASVGGAPAMFMTEVRPDAVHTSFLALAVWMDPKLVRFEQHPGVEVPGNGTFRTPPAVPDPKQQRLLAAFNGGFRMQDAQGGFYLDGAGASTLRDGDATLVINRDGTATVGEWGRDVQMSDQVASARQNLALIVDGGRPAPDLDENPNDKWGATVGNKVFVWRSGVGVTASGALVYVGGPSLSAKSLAETLVRAGAVRAMELDINHDWVSFNTYDTSAARTSGSKLLPEMVKPGDRYLSTDSRDFVAVLARDVIAPTTSQDAGPVATPTSLRSSAATSAHRPGPKAPARRR